MSRIVRQVDEHSLEILEWIEARSSAYPKVNLVFSPSRFVVRQTADSTFSNEKRETRVTFSKAGSQLVMKLTL